MRGHGIHMGLAGVLACVLGVGGGAWGADKADARAERAFDRLDANHDGSLTEAEYKAGFKSGQLSHVETSFKKLDKNGDKKLSREEMRDGWGHANDLLREDLDDPVKVSKAGREEGAFNALDTNHDGSLSAGELKAGMKDKHKDEADGRFRKIDDNRDGKVSKAEFFGAWGGVKDVLKEDVAQAAAVTPAPKADAPAGAKEVKDTKAAPAATAPAAPAPATKAGGDDEGSKGKGKGHKGARGPDADAMFDRFDTNHDGKLTLAEFQAGAGEEDREGAAKHFKEMDDNGDGSVQRSEFQSGWLHGKEKSEGKGKGRGKGKD